MTLCFIHTHQHLLLGMKKKGFGAGRWNGFGGKVHAGEPIKAAAARELEEECGIHALDLQKRGVIQFTFEGEPDMLEVHIFSGSRFNGEPRESDEMKPQWFLTEEIPFEHMWPDDRHWLPLLIAGKNFAGKFHFRREVATETMSDPIIHYHIEETERVT